MTDNWPDGADAPGAVEAVAESVAAAVDAGVAVVGPDSTVEWVDGDLANYLGADAAAIVGSTHAEFVETRLRPALANPDRIAAAATDADSRAHDLHVLPDGDRAERWLRYCRRPIQTGPLAGGRIELFTDVTAEQSRPHEQIVEALDDAVFLVDSDLCVRYANGAARRFVADGPLRGRPIAALVDAMVSGGAARESFEAALSAAFDAPGPDAVETVELGGSADSGSQTYRFTCTPLAGPDPQVVVSARDVSERSARDRQYETLVENFPDGAVTLVDDDMRYQLARGQLFETLDISRAAIEGEHVRDVDVGDWEPFAETYRDALDGESATAETTVGDRVLTQRTLPVFDDDGVVRTAIGVTQDCTERQTREREQRRTREFLGDTQSVAGVGGWEVDLRSDRLRWTDELYNIHGLPETYDPTISAALDFYHPADRPTVQRAYTDLTTDGEPFDLELRIVTAADEVRWVRTQGRPWTDEDGELVGARGTFQDITERRARERELRQKSRALDEAPVGISITDPTREDNPMVYVNRQFEELTGYDREAVLGRNCRFLQGEETDPEAVDALREAIEAERPVSVELRNYRRDGTMFWNRLEIAPVRDEAGEVVSFVGFQQDVTDRVVRERELAESRNRYRALVENFPNGAVALVDRDLRYSTVGGTPIEEAETTVSELEGRPLSAVLSDALADLLVPHYRAALDGEQRAFTRSVGGRDYRFLIVPVSDDDGEVFAAMGMSQDVTEERARERELRETRQRLDIALEETDTGVWVLDDETEAVTPFGTVADLFAVEGEPHLDSYLDSIHPDDRSAVETALTRSRADGARFAVDFRVEADGRERWVRGRGKRIEDDEETPRRVVGVTTDITEQKHRMRALERRERILRELHTATREFYPPRSMEEIAEFIIEFLENAFGFGYISVKQFDEAEGVLGQTRPSDANDRLGPVEPGDNPVWNAYRRGETQVFDGDALADFADDLGLPVTQMLVAPVGDFGVTLAVTTDGRRFDQVHVDLIEMLTANAESAFQRLRSDGVRTEIMQELSVQQARVDEMRGLVDAIQAIQQCLDDSDRRATLESRVCEELVGTDRVDFAWIGRPQGTDTDLSPVALAGGADGYLDSVLTGDRTSLPAVGAAQDHQTVTVSPISGRVFEEPWAKEALSYSFSSVMSTPLVYDDVLYGVLTVYSRTDDAFDSLYDNFVTDVASLLVNYSRILEQRQVGSERRYTTLEFELSGSTYPLGRLAAATDTTVQFDTVAETTTEELRVLVTVTEGDPEAVLDRATSMASIVAAEWFGSLEHRQLSLTVRRPFLASLVGRHGGRVTETVSTADGTAVRIELPDRVSKRPLLDSLTSRYDQIDLVAQRQRTRPEVPETGAVTELLTDRQYEILNAAYHGGYYETPREVTGENLAASFDISSPAVYNHLQAAHRTLLRPLFEGRSEVER